MFLVVAANTWLQYPAWPLTRSERLPLWAVEVSTVTAPAPEQSGAATVQSPVRLLPLWSSKPEQTTAPEQPVPALPVEVAVGVGVGVGEDTVGVGVGVLLWVGVGDPVP